MGKSKRFKMIIDIMMVVLMIVMMGYQITGNQIHEFLGMSLFGLFILHCILNRKWFMNLKNLLSNDKLGVVQIAWCITNLLLLLDMIIMMISSIMISKTAFAGLHIPIFTLWSNIHTIGAYAGFIIMSIHLGFHWNMVMNMVKKALHIHSENKERSIFVRILAFLLALLGVKSSFDRGIALKFLPPEIRNSKSSNEETYNEDIEKKVASIIPIKYGNSNGNSNSNQKRLRNRDNNGSENNDSENNIENTSSETQSAESLEQYLSNLVCDGCGKRCPLISPRCGIGVEKAAIATAEYESSQNNQTTETMETNDPEVNQSDNLENEHTEYEEEIDKTKDVEQIGENEQLQENDQKEEISLEDYLGNITCDGCGRRCLLTNPQCGIGAQKAKEAEEEYYAIQSSVNTTESNTKGNSDLDTMEEMEKHIIDISVKDNMGKLFADYTSIMGLYVFGTHYILRFVNKKKK